MATKLKNMELTSVDLVKAGANQEASICIFKSLDGEAKKEPEDVEKNDQNRFDYITELDP